jgi:hypothetical protein
MADSGLSARLFQGYLTGSCRIEYPDSPGVLA